MLLIINIPRGLEDNSNEELRSKVDLSSGQAQYNWFISYLINYYDVILNAEP